MSGEGQKLEHIQETINDRDKSLNIELWFGHIFHLYKVCLYVILELSWDAI